MKIKRIERTQCLICDKTFKNFIGLQIHKSKKHKRVEINPYPKGPQKVISLSKDEYCLMTIDEIFNSAPKIEECSSDLTSMDHCDFERNRKISKMKSK